MSVHDKGHKLLKEPMTRVVRERQSFGGTRRVLTSRRGWRALLPSGLQSDGHDEFASIVAEMIIVDAEIQATRDRRSNASTAADE